MLNILGRKYLTTKYVSKLIKYFKQSSSLLFFVRQLRDRVGTCQDNFFHERSNFGVPTQWGRSTTGCECWGCHHCIFLKASKVSLSIKLESLFQLKILFYEQF